MVFGYARVCSSLHEQLKALLDYGISIDNIIIDTNLSSKDARENLADLIEKLCPEDTLVFWRLDIVAKSLYDLNKICNELIHRNIYFKSLTENEIDTSPSSKSSLYTINFFKHLLNLERSVRSERTSIGLYKAVEKGVKIGPPKGTRNSYKTKAQMCVFHCNEGKLKIDEICKRVEVSKATYYNYIRKAGLDYKIKAYKKRT